MVWRSWRKGEGGGAFYPMGVPGLVASLIGTLLGVAQPWDARGELKVEKWEQSPW